jgi:hypothetical protein
MIRAVGARTLVAALIGWACAVGGAAAVANPTGAMSELTAVSGQGTGLVIVSPTSAGQGSFDARVKVNIHDAAPDTTFTVTRAVDVPSDGACTSTDFVTVATLQTSAGGAGAVEFERSGGTIPFDLFLRVLGSDGTVLESHREVRTAERSISDATKHSSQVQQSPQPASIATVYELVGSNPPPRDSLDGPVSGPSSH